ncbi:MAG TPA: LysR family transcriptional regulator [Candidatus Saccharimonadales bacterium]|nr:LysR family transcriptional regulator [Candidatus Saccharimonadales bacterium]
MEERLRKFAALVDAGSYTKASHQLHISQPALSAAINKLERELKADLLVHGSRALKLTKAGKLTYDSAKELNIVTSNLTTRISELMHNSPQLTIGMIDSVASILFASNVAVDELDPETKLAVVVNNSRYLAGAVEKDEIDIAFISGKPADSGSKFIIEHVAKEPMVLVCNSSEVANIDKSLEKGELPGFISYDQASATFRIIDDALKKYGIQVSSKYTSNSPAVALQLVLLQRCVAVLPYVLVKYYIDNGQLALIGNERPVIIERPINMLKRRGKLPLSAATAISRKLGQLMEAYNKDINRYV